MQFASMHAVEWIVVDNDSKDNSSEIITRAFPFVKWIQMPYNAGFARANNEGIKTSRWRYNFIAQSRHYYIK